MTDAFCEVYGASDDLIEIEGGIREEFNPPYADDDGSLLGFSNGVLLRVVYDPDGFWRIRALAGGDQVAITPGTDVEDDYSDRARILTPVTWVVHGTAWAKP